MSSIWSGLVRGAAAGTAGITALTATTYLDPAARARGLAEPGPLAGMVSGVALGSLAGLVRGAGVRLPTAVGGPLLGAAAMALPTARSRHVEHPRRWTAAGHLLYGLTTHATLIAVSRVAEDREAAPEIRPATVLRAAALGAASGSRSTAGIAAVALTSGRDDDGAVASRLGGRAGTTISVLMAAGELVADKLPATPSRLAGPGLIPRAALGATSAAGMARRDGADPALPGVVGLAGALAASVAGVRLRAAAARRFGSDRPGALAEDGLAALLGWLGARRPAAGLPPGVTTAEPISR